MSSNEGPRPFVNESNNSLGGDTSILNHKIANDSTDEDVFFSFEILHCDPTKEEAYGDCWAGWVDPSIKDGFFKYILVEPGIYRVRHSDINAHYDVPVKPGPPRAAIPIINDATELEESYHIAQKRRKNLPDTFGDEQRARWKAKKRRGGQKIRQRQNEGPPIDPDFTGSDDWKLREILKLTVDPFQFKGKRLAQKDLDQEMREYMEKTPPLAIRGDGYLVIESTLKDSAPKYLLFRSYSKAISPTLQANLLSLVQFLCIGDGESFTGIKAHVKNKLSRSTFNALYLSAWGHYSKDQKGPNGVWLSRDTTNQKHPALRDAIKRFQILVRKKLSPLLLRYLRVFDPDAYQFQLLIRQRMAAFLSEEMGEWGCDYGGVFFTIALSRGASSRIHIDVNDYEKGYAFLIPLGTYEGGGLTLPTCHATISLVPGQFLAFSSSLLPHFIENAIRTRYVITGFTDRFVAARSHRVLMTLGYGVSDLNFI